MMEKYVLRLASQTGICLENILKAEDYLRQAGITFDTGYDIEKGVRHWFFDFEVEHVTVVKIDG